MLKSLYPLARSGLFLLDAETAHHLTLNSLAALAKGGLLSTPKHDAPPVRVMGLDFPSRVGLAAGLDKDGAYIDGLAALGFGFLEIGTVTPKPQSGNPKPRMFRLSKANAIINRMGFNNGGVERFIANIQAARFRGILGLNIGKNAATPIDQALNDYRTALAAVYPFASYVTVNISSPNTKNLRQLQGGDEFQALLAGLKHDQGQLATRYGRHVPLAVKIAPDLDDEQIKAVSRSLLDHGIEAVIATNTTVTRDAVAGLPYGTETGGLSGAPVRDLSDRVIQGLHAELGSQVPIIGVGGILSGADALRKIALGAQLVQLYTGLIYRGPALIEECHQALNGPLPGFR